MIAATRADRARGATLVGQRVFGIALGYEDLIDHDRMRHDPVLATVLGKLAARRRTARRWPASRRSTGSSTALPSPPLPPHRLRSGGDRGAVRQALHRGAQAAAETDHPRSRRHR
jgi:hypothetical protein